MVCFDESPKQLIGEVGEPLPAEPGKPARQDTEYQRNGVRDLMMICEPKRGWRDVLIMERRTKVEFAHCMRHIVAAYPDAEVIRVVLDNLNTHKAASLYAAFPPEEARAIARKIEFHYTPKHGSWLNIAELELSVLTRQCLDRRMPDLDTLRQETQAWETRRNTAQKGVDWRFTTPTPASSSDGFIHKFKHDNLLVLLCQI